MKEIIIKHADKIDHHKNFATRDTDVLVRGNDEMEVSDGYHTFDELYDHRITLYIALCRTFKFAAESGCINCCSVLL